MIITRTIHMITRLFSDENLTKKAYLNILNTALSYVIKLGVLFIITPLMVTGLGTFVFGLWQIINRTVGYISPASGRPTEALQWVIANQQASKDFDLKRKYFGSAIAVWIIFLPIVVVLGSLIAWFLPIWFDIPLEYFSVVRITTLVLVANVSIQVFSEMPQSILRGENLGYKRMGYTVLLTLVSGGATWLALVLNTGIIGISIAAAVTTALNGFLYLVLAKRYTPWFGLARPSFDLVRQFMGLSGWFIAWNLVWVSMFAIDVVLLGRLASVELVTVYTLTKYVPEILVSVTNFLIAGVAPGIGGIVGKGELKRASNLRGELMLVTWLISASLGATILMWNRTFMGLWVGSHNFAGPFATLFIVAVVFQFVLIQNDATIIDVTLKLNKKVALGALSVVLTIGLAILFLGYLDMGIIGLCLSLILGRLVISVGYPYLVGNALDIPVSDQIKSIIRPALVAVMLLLAGFGLERLVPAANYNGISGWFMFFVTAMLSFVFFILFAYFFGLSSNQQKSLLNRAKLVMGMNRPA